LKTQEEAKYSKPELETKDGTDTVREQVPSCGQIMPKKVQGLELSQRRIHLFDSIQSQKRILLPVGVAALQLFRTVVMQSQFTVWVENPDEDSWTMSI